MLNWLKPDGRRKSIRNDRKYIVERARRLLLGYLGSDDLQKRRYYELVPGAAAACQPEAPNPTLSTTDLSREIAQTAFRVVKGRARQATADSDDLQKSITDAYATVAMAYRRAAALYVLDEEMQQIGTAAVHMVTMANSFMAARSEATQVAVQ